MNPNEKRAWHAPTFRSLDANRTAQGLDGPTFTTDDTTADDYVTVPDTPFPGSEGPGFADHS